MKRRSIIITSLMIIGIIILIFAWRIVENSKSVSKVQETDIPKSAETDDRMPEEMDGPIYNDDGSVTIPEGYTANGFYDLETNKIIDSGTVIELSDDVLQGKIKFRQNFPVKIEYLLIILIDYTQHEFEIEGQSFQSYSFSLEGESEIVLDISVNLTESEGTEFSYMVIPKPEEKNFLVDGKYNWDTMFATREWIVDRFGLDRGDVQVENEQEYAQNNTEFHMERSTSGIELVSSRDDLTVAVEGEGGGMLELVILNQGLESEDTDYVVLGFLDWQQIPVDGEHMKYYVSVPSDTSVSVPVIFPEVEEPAVFQIIVFKERKKFERTAETTFRVLVF